MEKRVVITGMGIWACIGKNTEEVTQSLREGRSGIGLDPARRELGYISSLTGIVEQPNLKGVLDRRKRLCLPQQGEYAYMATAEAMRNAGMDEAYLAANEVGIIYGNDSSAAPVIEGIDIIRARRNTAMVGSGNIFQSMNSTVTMNLSVIFNLRGINLTLSAACASGSHAIGMGYLMIRQGLQERVVCGGAQEGNLYSVGSFDVVRNCVLFKETAVRRGAAILGEVAGYGFSSNGEHISVPNVDGPRRSLLRCLEDAGMRPEEIPYVNAHATSTPLGDYNEAEAIAGVFAGCNPYVASTKSMTGHEMWMAGASEVVYSMLMMRHGFIAPNINFTEGDEATSKLNIPVRRVDTEFDCFLSNSFGFGGTNSTLIVKKYK